jgi:hypothetical protein
MTLTKSYGVLAVALGAMLLTGEPLHAVYKESTVYTPEYVEGVWGEYRGGDIELIQPPVLQSISCGTSGGGATCYQAVAKTPFSFSFSDEISLPVMGTYVHGGLIDEEYYEQIRTHENGHRDFNHTLIDRTFGELENWSSSYSSNYFNSPQEALSNGHADLQRAYALSIATYDNWIDHDVVTNHPDDEYYPSEIVEINGVPTWRDPLPDWAGEAISDINEEVNLTFPKLDGNCVPIFERLAGSTAADSEAKIHSPGDPFNPLAYSLGPSAVGSRSANSEADASYDDPRSEARGRASAYSGDNSVQAGVTASSSTANPQVNASAVASASLNVSVTDVERLRYTYFLPALLANSAAHISINGSTISAGSEAQTLTFTQDLSGPTWVQISASASVHVFGFGSKQASLGSRVILSEAGQAATAKLHSQSPDNRSFYAGAPVRGEVGISMPLYLSGPDLDEVGFGAVVDGYSTLAYSVELNQVVSIVIPGQPGDDLLLLIFNDQTSVVEPGSVFHFPGSVNSFELRGNGLSAFSPTGFIFGDSGLADIYLNVEVGGNLDGDFNNDGTVDAADYTVWRDGLKDAFMQADYDEWKANFGQTVLAGGGSVSTAVPEPSVLALFAIGCAAIGYRRQ